jgi:hypothetical protein
MSCKTCAAVRRALLARVALIKKRRANPRQADASAGVAWPRKPSERK